MEQSKNSILANCLKTFDGSKDGVYAFNLKDYSQNRLKAEGEHLIDVIQNKTKFDKRQVQLLLALSDWQIDIVAMRDTIIYSVCDELSDDYDFSFKDSRDEFLFRINSQNWTNYHSLNEVIKRIRQDVRLIQEIVNAHPKDIIFQDTRRNKLVLFEHYYVTLSSKLPTSIKKLVQNYKKTEQTLEND